MSRYLVNSLLLLHSRTMCYAIAYYKKGSSPIWKFLYFKMRIDTMISYIPDALVTIQCTIELGVDITN